MHDSVRSVRDDVLLMRALHASLLVAGIVSGCGARTTLDAPRDPGAGCRVTEPTVLFSGTTDVRAITQDDQNVYWADSGAWTIDSIAKAGGGHVLLAKGEYASGLAVQDGLVYWADATTIATVPSTGGAVADLASTTGSFKWAVAVAGGDAYWTSSLDTLVRRVDGSPNGAVVADVGEQGADALAATTTDVFWVSFASAKLYRYSIANATVTTLATPPAGQSMAVATDGVNVYWTDLTIDGAHEMTIYRVPITGGAPTALATIALGQCFKCWASLATDGTFVYFTDGAEDDNGTIGKVPVTGGPVTILADHQDGAVHHHRRRCVRVLEQRLRCARSEPGLDHDGPEVTRSDEVNASPFLHSRRGLGRLYRSCLRWRWGWRRGRRRRRVRQRLDTDVSIERRLLGDGLRMRGARIHQALHDGVQLRQRLHGL